MIRRARQEDVRFIHGLLSRYGQKGELLARPLTEIYDFLRDFVVAEDENGERVGACALHFCWEDLCEVRSLAVLPEYQGQGLGPPAGGVLLVRGSHPQLPQGVRAHL